MTEQTDAAEVTLSDIVEDLTDLPLSWDFFPEPDVALDDVARLIRSREAAAEARGAERALAAVEEVTVWMVPEGYVSGYSSKAAVAALRLDETLKAVRAAQVAPSRVSGEES